MRQTVERRPRRHSNPLQAGQIRQAMESERLIEYRKQRRSEFRRKREEHCSKTVRQERLADLFQTTVNSLVKEFQSKRNDWESWQAFKGAYEEAMHLPHLLIMKALNRKAETMYDQRRISPQIQNVRAQQTVTIFAKQAIQRRLGKMKSMLEQLDESQEDSAVGRMKQTKIVGEMYQFLKLISPDARGEVFGDKALETTWCELNTSGDHRTSENRRLAQLKKQICEYFGRTWGASTQAFFGAEQESLFHLDKKLSDEDSPEEMMEYMLSADNVQTVISSRDRVSTCRNHGVIDRIIKTAGPEAIKFMKRIIKPTIRCDRVFESWKEARTVLIYKKGERTHPKNWRPITITNYTYRIYTCLMARAFQQVNSQHGIYADTQKDFIKKTNKCSKQSITLKEFFQDAKRKSKDLIVTAIDFTNAFGSAPHELIMSMLKQLNFLKWVRAIVKDLYDDAKSTIEYKGNQTRPITWRKGVKQGCSLSPLLATFAWSRYFKRLRGTMKYTEHMWKYREEESSLTSRHMRMTWFSSRKVKTGFVRCSKYWISTLNGQSWKSTYQNVQQRRASMTRRGDGHTWTSAICFEEKKFRT
jgi:chaperonin cofactor prefoldin